MLAMTQMVVVALLAVAAATTVTAKACSDPCFCPTTDVLICENRELSRPPEGYWPAIRTLDIAYNNIAVLYSKSFSGFPDISALYLAYNNLTELDLEVISELPKLSSVELQGNQIETILPAPTEALTVLRLENNRISSLDPDVFQGVPNLGALHLDSNPLVVQEGQPFLNHPTLLRLSMHNVDASNVGPKTFTGLPNLRIIHLNSAGISDITGVFTTFSLMDWISLQNNPITELTAGILPSGNSISRLYLDECPLERLDLAAVKDSMRWGGLISITNTPLACSCGYEDLFQWAQSQGPIDIYASCYGADVCSFTKRTNF